MRIVVWLAEGTWQACVDAAAEFAPPDARIVLLHVIDSRLAEDVHGAYAGLAGRGGQARDPGEVIRAAAETAEGALLGAAAARLGRPAERETRRGHLEREVVAATAGADLLVVARDGDHARLGPRSLAPPTRYVVDHAACRVLLVWPDGPPALTTLP